jgi:hypothetical protein
MGRSGIGGATRWRGLAIAATLAAVVLASADARADEPEPTEDGTSLTMQSGPVEPQPEPTALQRLGELTWARWMLSEEVETPMTPSPTLPRGPWLDLADMRSDHWTARPVAITATASAFASMVSAGMPFLRVVKNGKLRQRHCLRAFFKSRGVAISWRIEF